MNSNRWRIIFNKISRECPPKCVKISNLKPKGGWTLPGRRVFPSDMSVLKSLYLAALELAKKWNRSVIKDWGIIYGQLSVIFEERLEA